MADSNVLASLNKTSHVVVFVFFELALSTIKIPGVFTMDEVRVPFVFEAALWTWIAHSIPPTKLYFVHDEFDLNDGAHQIINVVAHQERVDILHGIDEALKTTH